jgi:uncharacterized protein YdhG (YjbR/CyaY superfamily)
MRKTKSGGRSAGRSPVGARSGDVDDYIARTPEPARSMLREMRAAIRAAVPPDTAEIISYRIPAFKRKRVLVWYAAFANHCSLFPTGSIIEAFQRDLDGYVISKGTIQFPLDRPVPTALIKKLVRARVAAADSGKP